MRWWFAPLIAVFWLSLVFISDRGELGTASALGDGTTQQISIPDWREGKALYDAGRFEEALRTFAAQPDHDAAYYYNLANTYYRLGKLGISLAYFEKANRLKPHDPEILQNLALTRKAVGNLVGQDHLDPASTPFEITADGIPLEEVRAAIGFFALLLTLIWIRNYWKTRTLRIALTRPAAVLGLLAFLISTGLYAAQRLANAAPPAACVDRQVVRSGPGDRFAELARLEPGTKVRTLGPVAEEALASPGANEGRSDETTRESWSQIRYAQDAIGWIRSSSLLLL